METWGVFYKTSMGICIYLYLLWRNASSSMSSLSSPSSLLPSLSSSPSSRCRGMMAKDVNVATDLRHRLHHCDRWRLVGFHRHHWVKFIQILFSDNWTITDQLMDKWTAHKLLQCQETNHWRNDMWIVCQFCVILLIWVGLAIVIQLEVDHCASCYVTSVNNGQWSIVMIGWTWTLTWTDIDSSLCGDTGFWLISL